MNILVPVLCVALFGSMSMFFLTVGIPMDERRRLLRVAAAALFIRVLLAVLMDVIPELRLIHDDASGYEANAIAVAQGWLGLGPRFVVSEGLRNYGYLYIGGALCYLFGAYPLQLSVWNSLFGTLTVIVIYRLTTQLFHPVVAYRVALLLSFMPSMIVWSAVAIKDPVMVLLISCALYAYVRLRQRWSGPLLMFLTAVIWASYFIRFYISVFLVLSIAGTVAIGRVREGTSRSRNLIILGAFTAVVAATGMSKLLSDAMEMATLEQIALYRYGMASTANSGFAHDLDIRSPRGAALALPIGLAVILFGPFPWQMKGLLPLATLPEMLFWWSLVPSLWRGLKFAFRHAFSSTAPLFLFAISLSVAYALMLGNVGAAVRQRAQIFLVLFIFVALGQYTRFCQKRGVDPGVLLRS